MLPFSLPSSNLQNSLLSYLVRRFLAPLLDDGLQSLNNQSPNHPGTFTLRNLKLNPKALQDHLAGSILPFTIQSASLSQISLEINWPPWSFSLQGYIPDVNVTLDDIQIDLAISDLDPPQSQSTFLESINIDQNLANIASDFVRDEWSDSPDDDSLQQDFPGAFSTTPHPATSSAPQDRQGFFAGLVHKILSKVNFQFNCLNILLNHQQFQLLLSIDKGSSLSLAPENNDELSAMSREVRISCPTVYLHPVSNRQNDPMPSPNSSSNQSFDSEHDMFMSQATVDLRGPPLFVSATDILQVTQHPTVSSISNPENILLQFTPTSTASASTHYPEPSTESTPISQSNTSHEPPAHHLNPSQSLRFMFWLIQGSSSENPLKESVQANPLDSTEPSEGDKIIDCAIPSSKLKIRIHLPILSASIRLPHHLDALDHLILTVLGAAKSAKSMSCNSDSTISVSSNTPSLAMQVDLLLDAFNLTTSFPIPFIQCQDRIPLSSIIIETQKIHLAYHSQYRGGSDESQPSKDEAQLSIKLEQIRGRCNIQQQHKSTRIHSTFLSVPARDDDRSGPALSIELYSNLTLQIILGAIWISIDLDILAFMIPIIQTLQQTQLFTSGSSVIQTSDTLEKNPENDKQTVTESFDQEQDASLTTVAISIPCLYLDVKSFTTAETRQSLDQERESGLVLGSVVKSLQVIMNSKQQLSCSFFEAALGFRIGTQSRSLEEGGGLVITQRHAPLEPFLGIAHPIIPDANVDPKIYPGFRLTHTFGSHKDPKPSCLQEKSRLLPSKPTCIKLETVTIDFTKQQFDRLQYWLDDLSRWASKFLLESAPCPSSIKTESNCNTCLQEECCDLDNQSNPKNNLKERNLSDSDLLGSLTVSKISIYIRLPLSTPSSHDNNSSSSSTTTKDQRHVKLLLKFDQLELLQICPSRVDHRYSHQEHGDFNQIKLTILSCNASLLDHQKNVLSILLTSLDNSSVSLDKQPSTSIAICTQSPVSKPKSQIKLSSTKDQKDQLKLISVGIDVRHVSLRLGPCCIWTDELVKFLKAPAGVFEAVGPEYETQIKFSIVDCSIQLISPSSSTITGTKNDEGASQATPTIGPGGFIIELVSHQTHLQISLDPASSSTQISPSINGTISINLAEFPGNDPIVSTVGSESISFAQIALLNDFQLSILYAWCPSNPDRKPTCQVKLHKGSFVVSLCADSADGLGQAISRVSQIPFKQINQLFDDQVHLSSSANNELDDDRNVASSMLRSAMKEPSSASSRPLLFEKGEDLADEDYPTDAAFLDRGHTASHSGHSHLDPTDQCPSVIIRSLCEDGLEIIDDYLLRTRVSSKASPQNIEAQVKVEQLDVSINLYDGYDWNSTRQTIQQAQKTVRKRLQKIRQLLATGNPADARSIEEDLIRPTSTKVFNSVQLGLNSETRGLSPAQLINVIDHQLKNQNDSIVEPSVLDDEVECMTGSWQSLAPHSPPTSNQPHLQPSPKQSTSSKLGRSTQPMLKLVLNQLKANFRKFDHDKIGCIKDDQNKNQDLRLCNLLLKIDSLTIIDNIKSSTWKKFLTELRPNEGGLLRPTGEPMLRFKFDLNPSTSINTSINHSSNKKNSNEAILKLKISPLRLYVDQDAVDFLKNFFSFHKDTQSPSPTEPAGSEEMFFQRVEILPIRIKLDYKPKRINYMALKEGKTIELMNFFHFEGSDMVLRHATLTGVSRASKIGELLQEIWTPDVKANQLAEVISGISPVRSVVNLGTGIADLILLPIEEIKKKDGRLSRGISKGTTSFAKNTTLEVIKLGAKLATGTQVILEKAESIFGGGSGSGNKSNQDLRVETIDHHHLSSSDSSSNEVHVSHHEDHHLVSKYANQPPNFKAGAQLAYQDLRENFRSTAQTILAIPLEVFNEGSGQAVVKAIPIAFIHPMVGASSAISKTLLGLQNSLGPHDPSLNDDKYK